MNIIDKLFMQAYADSERFDPLKNFNFLVSFSWKNGTTFMSSNFGFNKVSGFKADVDVIEYREGGDNISVRKMAGLTKFDPLTFEKGMTNDLQMWNAFKKIFNIDVASATGSAASSSDADSYRGTLLVEIQNRKKTSIKTLEVRNAWISSFEVTDLDAQGSSVVMERMVIQNEGWQFV